MFLFESPNTTVTSAPGLEIGRAVGQHDIAELPFFLRPADQRANMGITGIAVLLGARGFVQDGTLPCHQSRATSGGP